jgi:hypothetical protein
MLLWYQLLTLMADAVQVIEMRLHLIALGKGTSEETFLMVSEKIDAMAEARAILIRSGDPSLIIENYRKIVAANVPLVELVPDSLRTCSLAYTAGIDILFLGPTSHGLQHVVGYTICLATQWCWDDGTRAGLSKFIRPT